MTGLSSCPCCRSRLSCWTGLLMRSWTRSQTYVTAASSLWIGGQVSGSFASWLVVQVGVQMKHGLPDDYLQAMHMLSCLDAGATCSYDMQVRRSPSPSRQSGFETSRWASVANSNSVPSHRSRYFQSSLSANSRPLPQSLIMLGSVGCVGCGRCNRPYFCTSCEMHTPATPAQQLLSFSVPHERVLIP